MIAVIIAGGAGTRLWPLSTPAYPKHLLAVDDDRSLLQHTYERAALLSDKVYVVSEAGHIEHVREQLHELPDDRFIVEPMRRGTASCIALALAHIAQTHDDNEPIAFLAADHYINDNAGFMLSFRAAARLVQQRQKLVLIGVEPTYPATGFGYIQKGNPADESGHVYDVVCFREKPDYGTARAYIKSGEYLWNCGYFVGTRGLFERAMERYAPVLYQNYRLLSASPDEGIAEVYGRFENVSIDYALIEKMHELLVIPARFDWLDLGSFADMYKVVEHDKAGNYISGEVEIEEVQHSFVKNLEDKPVVLVGLDNVVVVNTPQGVVVAGKDYSQKIGDVSKRLMRK